MRDEEEVEEEEVNLQPLGPLLDGTQNGDLHRDVSGILNDLFLTFMPSVNN